MQSQTNKVWHKVYSLSYQDSINTNYGFESDDHAKCKKRSCKVTDYSKAKGSYTSRIDDYLGNGYYWLRSPHQGYTDHAWIVDYDGMNYPGYEIDNPSSSVRPCIAIDINWFYS